jgi:hypothetical protein
MEGDTDVARLSCACCQRPFRALIHLVTVCEGKPVCRPCVERYNPVRIARGLPPAPLVPEAYL